MTIFIQYINKLQLLSGYMNLMSLSGFIEAGLMPVLMNNTVTLSSRATVLISTFGLKITVSRYPASKDSVLKVDFIENNKNLLIMNNEEKVLARRLWVKNDSHTLIKNLQQRYSMPLAAAEMLEKELKDFFANTGHLDDGQEYFTAVDWQEPAGKPLKDCCTHRVRLTVRNRSDLSTRSTEGLTGYFKKAIPRICWQALEQNALLTQEDIAFLLNTSRATVKRICKKLKQEGFYLPTRGNYHDIGPGTSHKYEAVKLYIKGLEPSEIGQRMGHSLNAIERYISDFSLVVAASEEDYNAVAISRFTAISEKVVREYLVLYDRFWLNPELKPFMDDLVADFKERKLLKKSINQKKSKNE